MVEFVFNTPPTAREQAIQAAMAASFPVLAAKVDRLEDMVASLRDINLQMAKRVATLERAAAALA